MELNENKTTLDKEHSNYAEMSATFKKKQEHYTTALNDLSGKK